MELFREFFGIAEAINEEGLEYSVVGGIAMAFHSEPRFTRDIDILARPPDLPRYRDIFSKLGFVESARPIGFVKTKMTLHRFWKKSVEDREDLIVVDLLIGHEEVHESIIRDSLIDESSVGMIRLAKKNDLIWMKKIRGSKQDEADIERLAKDDE